MADFIKTVEIGAPPDRVWNVMMDIEHWPEWTRSVTSIRRLDAGSFGIGSRARVKQPKLLPAVWIVTQVEVGRSFTWVSRMPGLRVTGRHAVESVDHGSRVILSIEFQGLLRALAACVFRTLNEEYINMEAMGLKRHCEARNK
jgi:uncharacterized membrane protein